MRADNTSTRRSGASLVEAITAMALASIIVGITVGMGIAQMRLARITADRAITSDALRTATTVLTGEARRMAPTDVRAAAADSLAIRAFRGAAIPCGTTAGGMLVRYAGDRLPDPSKDSLLAISSAGTAAEMLLASAAVPGECTALPHESVYEWRASGPLPSAGVLLLYESGSYHLTSRALRYRIGAAGRQPLTAEVLDNTHSAFGSMSTRGVRLDITSNGRQTTAFAAFPPNAAQ